MDILLAVILGYALGSVPVSPIVARRHGVDLSRTGDGNPGAWNALEQLGPRRAWPAFAGDGLKGLCAGLAGLALGGFWLAVAGVAAAILGHGLTVGGKGIMTFAGGAFALSPVAAAISLALCAAMPSFAWGARAGIFAFPLIQLAFDPVERVAATGGLMSLFGALFLARRFFPARSSRAEGPGEGR